MIFQDLKIYYHTILFVSLHVLIAIRGLTFVSKVQISLSLTLSLLGLNLRFSYQTFSSQSKHHLIEFIRDLLVSQILVFLPKVLPLNFHVVKPFHQITISPTLIIFQDHLFHFEVSTIQFIFIGVFLQFFLILHTAKEYHRQCYPYQFQSHSQCPRSLLSPIVVAYLMTPFFYIS